MSPLQMLGLCLNENLEGGGVISWGNPRLEKGNPLIFSCGFYNKNFGATTLFDLKRKFVSEEACKSKENLYNITLNQFLTFLWHKLFFFCGVFTSL